MPTCIVVVAAAARATTTTSRGSVNTGFGLRIFLALWNKRTLFCSMTCSSKPFKQILLVTFTLRLTQRQHLCFIPAAHLWLMLCLVA